MNKNKYNNKMFFYKIIKIIKIIKVLKIIKIFKFLRNPVEEWAKKKVNKI